MSVPTGSDASTGAGESGHEPPTEDRGVGDSSGSIRERVTDWARHWQAWSVAGFSLLVVGWAAFLQPQTSPKGYIPIFLGFAALAVGYVYLDEESQVRLASG
ncbi:hypothetical protein [Salinigranum halophilum]|uniref:hypothetical protein n=1 Tax=Salinigranum halophilum TaxID=2565931 RepID=UPI0010A857EB|nr:hypothetical protein [Salinigranum halophilum]